VLALSGLLFGLLAFPFTALAQTTPGPGNSTATLRPLSLQDNRIASAVPPAQSGPLLTVFTAVGTGRASLNVGTLGVEPQNLGVFTLISSANRQDRLALAGILEHAVFSGGAWARIPATYNALRKTLNFSVTNGMIYAVFALQPEAQRTLPDSGGQATDLAQPEAAIQINWWAALTVLAGLFLIGTYLFSVRTKKRKDSQKDLKSR
jgi:hypothetical protein